MYFLRSYKNEDFKDRFYDVLNLFNCWMEWKWVWMFFVGFVLDEIKIWWASHWLVEVSLLLFTGNLHSKDIKTRKFSFDVWCMNGRIEFHCFRFIKVTSIDNIFNKVNDVSTIKRKSHTSTQTHHSLVRVPSSSLSLSKIITFMIHNRNILSLRRQFFFFRWKWGKSKHKMHAAYGQMNRIVFFKANITSRINTGDTETREKYNNEHNSYCLLF